MARFFVGMVFSVVVARWAYSEVKLAWPNLIPFIDYSLERVQIPTHDQWPVEELKAAAARAISNIQTQTAEAYEGPAPAGANFSTFEDRAAVTF